MSTTTLPQSDATPAENGTITRAGPVLVAVPAGLDPQPLQEALDRHGLPFLFADESPVTGTISDVLSERLRRANVVLAALTGTNDADVLFQIGFARALNKRVVVLAADPERSLPEHLLAGMIVFEGTIADQRKVESAVEAAAFTPRDGGSWPPPVPESTPLGDLADSLLAQLPTGKLDTIAVHEAIGRSFLALGIETSVSNDLEYLTAAWVKDLAPWVRNPFLIHAQGSVDTPAESAGEAAAFGATLRERGADWGLTVAGHLSPAAATAFKSSRVLVAGVRDLLARLRTETLAEIILDLRRQRIRGRS